MTKFFYEIRVSLWVFIAELEYILYPWKTKDPPYWAVEKYNLDHGIEDQFENSLSYGWIKSHDQKINKIEEKIISLNKEIQSLKNNGQK